MPRFANYQAHLRRSSAVQGPFPFATQTVTLLRVSATGQITQATTLHEKRAMVRDAGGKDVVLAAWPGQWRQDVFVVDDLAAARATLG